MSAVQVLSLVLLGLALVVAIWRRVNIGVLALAAAFPVMLLSHTDADTVFEAFPGNLFVLIAGVSLLFAHLERSGALGWVVERVYAAIGDRQMVLPWVGFALAAALSSAGAFSTAPIAFLVPMIAHIGVRYRNSFYLCELGVVIGANCAGLSPLNPTGAVVRTAADKYGVDYSGWGLWAVSVTVAIIVMAVLQAVELWNRRRGGGFLATPAPAETSASKAEPNRLYALSCGVALIAFLILVIFPKTDVGITSMALVVVLQLLFRPAEKPLLERVPWTSILLLCGLLTYLGLMQKIGTMTSIEHGLDHLGTGALLILVMAYMTALLCNIESSTLGVLGLMMPIVFSTFGDDSGLFWVIAAIAVPAALMVMNPIHVAGTLIIANSSTADQDRLFRRLLGLAVSLAVVAPGVLAIVPIALR